MASVRDLEDSVVDQSWGDLDESRPRRGASVDSSWSEPHGLPIATAPTASLPVAHAPLAHGSATIAALTTDPGTSGLGRPQYDDFDHSDFEVVIDPAREAPRFFNIPVVPQVAARPRTPPPTATRPNDATSIVKPLPRPLSVDATMSRVSMVVPEPAPRVWHRLTKARRRWQVAVVGGALTGVVLACIVLAASSSSDPPQARAEAPVVAPKRAAAVAPAPKRVAVLDKKPVAPVAKKPVPIAKKPSPPAKKTVAVTKKPAPAELARPRTSPAIAAKAPAKKPATKPAAPATSKTSVARAQTAKPAHTPVKATPVKAPPPVAAAKRPAPVKPAPKKR